MNPMENRSSYRKNYFEIFKGGSIALAGTIAGYLLNYAFKTITGRYFGPEGLGIMAYGISLMTIVSMLAVMGFDEGLGRFIPFYRNKEDFGSIKTILAFCAKISIGVSIVAGGTVYFNAAVIAAKIFKEPGAEDIIRVFALLVPMQTFFMLSTGLARGLKKMAAIAIARDIIMWGIKIAAALIIVYWGLTVEYVAAAFFAAFLGAGAYYYRKFRKDELAARLRSSRPVCAARKEFLKFSSLLIFSNLIHLLRKRTDIILIGIFLPASAVGLYYAALPFAMLLTISLFSINRIIMPVVTEIAGTGDITMTNRLFKDFALLNFQVTFPLFLFIFFFSDEILLVVYGREFAQAGPILRILSAGFFINASSGSFGEFFKAFGKPRLIFYMSLLGGVLNVALMIFLVPNFGLTGAAVSTSLVLTAMVLLGVILAQRVLKINPFSSGYFILLVVSLGVFAVFLLFGMSASSLWRLAFFTLFVSGYLVYFFKSNTGLIKSLKARKEVCS